MTGRRSDSSLYDYKLATYDSGETFDQKSSNGFIDIYGLPSRVAAARDVKFGNGIEVPKNTVESYRRTAPADLQGSFAHMRRGAFCLT